MTEPMHGRGAPRGLRPPQTGQAGHRRRSGPPLGVEANARLTAITGLVLVVMLAAEGVTILSIGSLISWHAAIGLALIPVVALKLGSTLWRFGRYYLGDLRYRAAGRPHPVLRVIGPVVVVTTAAVLATGVTTWVAGPHHGPWLGLHKASFVLWLGAVGVHVLAHLARAVRLALADVQHFRPRLPYRSLRMGLVTATVCSGVALGLAASPLGDGWTAWAHHIH